jgi:hypothetical protein
MFKVPNEYRIRGGELGSTAEAGNNGAFMIPFESFTLRVIASDGMGWEHVSVSLPNRTPNWRAMCFMTDVFGDAEDVMIKYHPSPSSILIPCGRWIFL